jgi:hypothetical protein
VTYAPGSAGAAAYRNTQMPGQQLPEGVAFNRDGSVTVRGPDARKESFGKTLGEAHAKNLLERFEKAQAAATSIENAAESKRLLDSGIIAGSGANWQLALNKALQEYGIVSDNPKVTNTEAFAISRATDVLTMIKSLGAGTAISNADLRFTERVAAGDITLEPDTIRTVLQLQDKYARRLVEKFNRDIAKVPTPFDMTVRMPEAAQPGGSGVTSSGVKWSIK